jgi:hypothetical protein
MLRRQRPLVRPDVDVAADLADGIGVPWASDSMRLPVPVCTLTIVSDTMRRAIGFGMPTQPAYQSLSFGFLIVLSSLQRWLCQMIFQSSSFWSYAKE